MNKLLLLILLFSGIRLHGQFIHDESHLDLSFFKFKAKLTEAIMEKNLDKLKPLLGDTIFESNNGCAYPGCDKAEFVDMYFGNGNDKETWETLQRVIRFGFRRTSEVGPGLRPGMQGPAFQAPSYLPKVKDGKELLILGENVNIRSAPGMKSKVIRRASYEKFACDCNIIDMTEETNVEKDGMWWVQIKLEDGQKGYVATKLTSEGLIKELSVVKIDGNWKVVSFYQGPGC